MASLLNATASAASESLLYATGGSTPLVHLPTPPFLLPILHLTTRLITAQAHPTYFPFPWMFVLHAVRCSFAWRGIIKGNTARLRAKGVKVQGLTWAADCAGFLLMSWGGGILSHLLTGRLPPQFLHPGAALTYLPLHLLISLFLSLPSLSALHPSAQLLDILSPYIDGATRAGAVALGVQLASSAHPESLMLQVVLGTLTACGGGQSCGTLGAWEPNGWVLGTPPALRARSWMEGVDVWAPFLAVLGYVVLGGTHEDVLPLTRPLVALLARFGLVSLGKGEGITQLAVLDPTAARALATLIITAAFVWRATVLHGQWATDSFSTALKQKPGQQQQQKLEARLPSAPTQSIEGKRRSVSEKVAKRAEREGSLGSTVDGDENGNGKGNGNGSAVRRSSRRKT
ncbi:unnamed protein product [Tilletia controversa]|uniref:Proteophosphoglycan ppg4 n=3 Tax=Tilletia TaxID=13289 RepID=A0A8X7MLY0_9BASI|nr:hypothetical protein CF336_g3463 [Tilletia laevis]KAE8199900.1 hypothetical protein CF328_g3117 [Tilletia controversa]KAE8252015.1 hypothetical protein A4X03_0g6272 [Tilletia caries]KAE8204223.1 hypothetical protein CF335_g2730 [Tilletia laevis]KAE8241856.1 hypothetical protein A4X06_0g7379 [Tilletia controversa]